MTIHRWLTALLFCLPPAATFAADDNGVREYVDETTAASITTSRDVLIFARERRDLAVNARDYVTLVPIEINQAGKRSCFWSGYLWSTIDRRTRQVWLAEGDELVLLADGRPMPLRSSGKALLDQGAAEPTTPSPTRSALPVLFPATLEEIAYVARASDVRIELLHSDTSESFVLWKGRPGALTAFSERVSP